MNSRQRWFRGSCFAALIAGAAITLPADVQGQLFPRLFQRQCCPDPCGRYASTPVYTQASGWNGNNGWCGNQSYYSGYGNSYSQYGNGYTGYSNGYWDNGVSVTSLPNTGVGQSGMAGVQVSPNSSSAYATAPGYEVQQGNSFDSSGNYDPTRPMNSDQRDNSQFQQRPTSSNDNWENQNQWDSNSVSPSATQNEQNNQSRPNQSRDGNMDNADDVTQSTQEFSAPRIDQEEQSNSSRGSEIGDTEAAITTLYSSKLYLANYCAMELSKAAQDKAEDENVREFAQMIAEDHQRLNERLKNHVGTQLASDFTSDTSGMRDEVNRDSEMADESQIGDRTEDRLGDRTVTSRANYDVSTDPLVQTISEVEQDAAKAAVEAAKESMNKYSGEDYDMGYVGMQIAHHTALMAQLEALQGVGSSDFQEIVRESTSMVEKHRAAAAELQKQLAQSVSSPNSVGREGVPPSDNP